MYEEFIIVFKQFLEECIKICDIFSTTSNIPEDVIGASVEKYMRLLEHEKMKPSEQMKIINKFYNKNRESIINYLKNDEVWFKNSNLEIMYNEGEKNASKIVKIPIGRVYNMSLCLKEKSESDENKKDDKLLPSKFMYYFLVLLYNCTLSNNEKDMLTEKIMSLGIKCGLREEQKSETPFIYGIISSLMSGDFKEKAGNLLSKENIENAKEFSSTLFGESKIAEEIFKKFDENSSDPFKAVTSVFNDKQLINEAFEAVKNIGESTAVGDIKNGIQNVVEVIGTGDVKLIKEDIE